MYQKEYAICFIDDDQDEIKRFKNNLDKDKLENGFIIGAGTTYPEALDDLKKQGRKRPDIFVLDLYYPMDSRPTEEQLQKLHVERKLYLKAQTKFRTVLAKLNQSSNGGITLAYVIGQNFKSIPYLFFTRKGTLDDAIHILKTKATKIMKKPDPEEKDESLPINEAYDKAFKENAKNIAGEIKEAIIISTWWYKNKKIVIGFIAGILSSLLASVIWSLFN
ncbi:hypothetical protein ISS37_10265 [candidate division KSB1 bacterium]|nr:hypothetical protein [candidate division KSB1 bacterium]